jgi:hypothetical protein
MVAFERQNLTFCQVDHAPFFGNINMRMNVH